MQPASSWRIRSHKRCVACAGAEAAKGKSSLVNSLARSQLRWKFCMYHVVNGVRVKDIGSFQHASGLAKRLLPTYDLMVRDDREDSRILFTWIWIHRSRCYNFFSCKNSMRRDPSRWRQHLGTYGVHVAARGVRSSVTGGKSERRTCTPVNGPDDPTHWSTTTHSAWHVRIYVCNLLSTFICPLRWQALVRWPRNLHGTKSFQLLQMSGKVTIQNSGCAN